MSSSKVASPLPRSWVGRTCLVLAASWALAASGYLEAPMWPVPMTAQTYAVLCIGAWLGARLAAATVAAYLAQGALGLPMFAGGASGLTHLLGPTSGYLFGFLLGAALVGWLIERGWGRTILHLLAAMSFAHALIFVLGVARLSALIGFDQAIADGLLPFIPGAFVKIAAAAVTIAAAGYLFRERGAPIPSNS